MKNSLLLSLLLLSIPALGALEDRRDLNSMVLALPNNSLIKRNIQEQINVLHDKDGFMVTDGSTLMRVKPYDVSPVLRNMDVNEASKVLAVRQLQVSKLSNGEYTINEHGELVGGGVIMANIAYWGVKTLAYGTAAAAGGAAVAAVAVTGGAAGGAIAGGAMAAASGGTASVGIAAGGIAGAGLTAEAVTATTAVVVTYGAATVAVIESVAVGAAMLAANPLIP